jgi:hypothetical protein
MMGEMTLEGYKRHSRQKKLKREEKETHREE